MFDTKHTPIRSLSRRLTLAVGLVATPLVLAAPSLMAQDQTTTAPAGQGMGGHHEDAAERQQHMLDMMTKKLNLNPDQVSQIKGIQADTMTQMQSLRSDSSTTGADRHTKMMDLHKAESDKIRGVLNDDQRTKYDAMVARRQERMHGGSQGQGAPAQQ